MNIIIYIMWQRYKLSFFIWCSKPNRFRTTDILMNRFASVRFLFGNDVRQYTCKSNPFQSWVFLNGNQAIFFKETIIRLTSSIVRNLNRKWSSFLHLLAALRSYKNNFSCIQIDVISTIYLKYSFLVVDTLQQ